MMRMEGVIMSVYRVVLSVLVGLLVSVSAGGQTQVSDSSAWSRWRRITEHRSGVRYPVSLPRLEGESVRNAPHSLAGDDARYLHANDLLAVGALNGEDAMRRYLASTLSPRHGWEGRWALFNARFRNKDYKGALEWLREVGRPSDGELAAEYDFKRGYSLLQTGDTAAALDCFSRLRSTQTAYAAHGEYYYAHIQYDRGENGLARASFLKLKDDPTFGPLVPYYLAQICYREGDYACVVDYVAPRLESAAPSRRAELLRLLGDSYFRLGKDSLSLAMWDAYRKAGGVPDRNELYDIGMCHYRLGQFEKAVEPLGRVATEDDGLSQNANYHLGDSYIRIGERDAARQALYLASRHDADSVLKEDALFQYARLSLEDGSDPFADASAALKEYIMRYPASGRADAARGYLGISYSLSRNYEQAIEELSQVKGRSRDVDAAEQRARYNRALELIKSGAYAEALPHLVRAQELGSVTNDLPPRIRFWRGECEYQVGEYAAASRSYKGFLQSAGAFSMAEYARGYYGLGYSLFAREAYGEASESFLSSLNQSTQPLPLELRTDAYNRLGDCRYALRQYWPAVEAYQAAAKAGGSGSDYAMYQEGFVYGVVDRTPRKIEVLGQFEKGFKESPMRVKALYELARTLQEQGDYARAESLFGQVATEYPGQLEAGRSLMQSGLIAYGRGDNAKARELFGRVLSEYADGTLRTEAMQGLERAYSAEGRTDEYLKHIDRLGYASAYDQAARDSLLYAAGFDAYSGGRCPDAEEAWGRYLQAYPNGLRSLEARYYTSRCRLEAGDTARAMGGLVGMARAEGASQRLEALTLVAGLYERVSNHDSAFWAYGQVERLADGNAPRSHARLGQIRSARTLGKHKEAIGLGEDALGRFSLSASQEEWVRFAVGDAAELTGDTARAREVYAVVGAHPSTPLGAESRYRLIRMLWESGDYAGVQREALALGAQGTSQREWLGRAYILLGRSYAQQGEFFQAKATLQSIIDNYKGGGDDVREQAEAALREATEAERSRQASPSDSTPKK